MQLLKLFPILFTILFISSCGVQQVFLNPYDQIERIEQIVNEEKSLTESQRNKLRKINSIYSHQYINAKDNNDQSKELINAAWNYEINLILMEDSRPNKPFARKYPGAEITSNRLK